MTDYIGKYVKQFESGTLGSLSLSSCGNDWGLSCGSYQLTLRWGNCINFLKKYFPTEATALFFNTSQKDIASKTWPGSNYCSSPDAVKSVWQKCYNKVGADKFFEYEHAWIEANYYVPIKNKVKDYLNLDTTDRAFQECFWSWSVHEGSGGAFTSFKAVLSENNITSLDYVDKEEFFDLIYDKRYEKAGTNRYKKGLTNGSSERETLRPLLTKGTFSGKVQEIVSSSSSTNSDVWYTVQVGAYSKESNANAQLLVLKTKGFSASIIQIDNLYKLKVGSYRDLNAAKSMQTLLKNNGFESIIVEDRGEIDMSNTKEFIPRKTAPSTTDKYWIHTSKGGLNDCILISGNSCIPNCVGYAYGRFYEIIGTKPKLSRANAENWYGYADGYKRSKTPALGAVICWAKGQVGVASDGAGHVAIVEEIKSNGDIITSNSGYNSTRFWLQTFTKASGYAMNGYTFQGFILPPDAEVFVSESVKVTPLKGTLKVILRNDVLNVRSSPEIISGNIVTTYSYGKTATVTGITEDNKWYQLSDGNFISSSIQYVQFTKTDETVSFTVRVKAGSTEIKKEASSSSTTVGKISQNGVYTIVEEKNGYGKLKSGAGWISLNSELVTRLT